MLRVFFMLCATAGCFLGWQLQAATTSCVTTMSSAISCTGTFDTPEMFFEEPFVVTGTNPVSVTIQTYGFGGGTNAAGTAIPAGGFDSLVALFSAAPEMILTDAFGNPLASVPGSTQFFAGCPPAGLRSIGGNPECGDNTLTATLMPGSYNLVLSDANYIPFAVSPGPPFSTALSDGFADLSGGVFQTCNAAGVCVTDTGNFAVDILGLSGGTAPTPEPATIWLLGSALAAGAFMHYRKGTLK